MDLLLAEVERMTRAEAAEIEVAADVVMQEGAAFESLSIIRHPGLSGTVAGIATGLAVDGVEVFRVSWVPSPDSAFLWYLNPVWLRPPARLLSCQPESASIRTR